MCLLLTIHQTVDALQRAQNVLNNMNQYMKEEQNKHYLYKHNKINKRPKSAGGF